MQITVGSRLGPYEIVALIGAGGMGEVYEARDTRLDRSVAIKVLPPAFADNAQLKQRFEREAKTISQLTHAHICTLYDVGNDQGVEYLVMELLDGESLADRIARGPLPMRDVLRYGGEIAEALDRAHRGGVVHRDLKPGNVMITKSGAKLLDFGLAKSGAIDFTSGSFAVAPDGATQQKALTQEGTILGTFQYMAPEQLEGSDADARTDIFAFGAVLYEMATGKRAFQGKNKTSLVAAIVSSEPPAISSIQPLAPPALEHVIKKCLAKERDDRWQSAHDIAEELKWIGEAGSQANASIQLRRTRRFRPGWFASFVLGMAATAAGVYALRDRFTAQRPLSRLTMSIPGDGSLALYGANNIAISPSGKLVAFVAEHVGVSQIYLRNLGSLDAIPVPGTEVASSIFFSSDSQWIGFLSGTHLQKIAVDGGAPQAICDAAEVRGGSWQGNTIVFAMGTSGVWSVPAAGGKPRLIASPKTSDGDDFFVSPELLPDGDTVLISAFRASRSALIAVSLRTGRRSVVAEDTFATRYLKNQSCLLFTRGSSLLAARFDAKKLQFLGPAVSVVDGILTIPPYERTLFAVSEDGTLVYAPGGVAQVKNTMVWVDRAGHITPIPFPPQQYEEPRLSPDGNRIAMTIRDATNADIWVGDLTRSTLTRLTFDPAEEETAEWSPDGRHIAFAATRSRSPRSIRWRLADGTGSEEQLLATHAESGHPHMSAFSPDGRLVAYTDFGPVFAGDIWIASLADHTARPFVATPFNERAPRFSPDAKYIAYTSNESGHDEVYVQSFPGPGGKWQISNEGGREAVWSPTGKEIFYRNGDKLMAADVSLGSSFSAGTPHVLFTGRFVPMRRGEPGYDVNRDGTRFLMVQREQSNGPQQLVVVQNWFEDLQRYLARGTAQ
jgi:eukaryotic-like serine/threonine-protein kinase